MIKKFELTPIYSTRKNFYQKAIVEEYGNGFKDLYSYNTLIASIDNENKLFYLTDNEEHYSMTTCSHLKEFCLQNDIEYLGKAKMLQLATKIK